MSACLYWFRNDLRLADNPAFAQACADSARLLPVYVHDARQDQPTRWGFARMGCHRRFVLTTALTALDKELRARGSRLLVLHGDARQLIPQLSHALRLSAVHVEQIAAPEEASDIDALRDAGLTVKASWQSTMLDPDQLPFAVAALPDVFTAFRTRVEKYGAPIASPLVAPATLPIWPEGAESWLVQQGLTPAHDQDAPAPDPRSAFPYQAAPYQLSESGAQTHLVRYLARELPHSYKSTRNGLIGADYSSKWSPFLALGTISARQLMSALRTFESEHGANEGTYWLWFELLWRDYFRFLHLKYGRQLYHPAGLGNLPYPKHNPDRLTRWREGHTGHAFVDAGMRELALTGYLSNRMRQVVASYLIHDLGCDWRAGAAWFESQLVDYDVYSNQGNWLYLAGRGTDPRGGRRFNPDKQATDYDPTGEYRALWKETDWKPALV